MVFRLLPFLFIFPLSAFASPDASVPVDAVSVSEAPASAPVSRDWVLDTTLVVPFRGFEVQTGQKVEGSSDPLASVSYSPSPSLEGSVFLAYQNFGFNYRHTLASASLDSRTGEPSSVNEEYRVSFFLEKHLLELSRQNLVGMQTDLAVDASGTRKRIARPDLSYSDWRVRWMSGLPLSRSNQVNSLANYYGEAQLDPGQALAVDLLYQVEAVQQKISGSSPFIPRERQAAFGSSATLREVSSTGLGAGVGPGLTALMGGKSYFSMAGLLGGNWNSSRAQYLDREENISGFGLSMNARMSVQWIFGRDDSQSVGFRLYLDSWTIPAKDEKVASSDAAMAVNYGVKF